MTDDCVSLVDTGAALKDDPAYCNVVFFGPTEAGGSLHEPWTESRGLWLPILLGGLMSGDAEGQHFAHRQLVFFSIHWMMWMSTQRRLLKSLTSNLNPKTDNLRGQARPYELFWSLELISLQNCIS